jgi:hypothetical protein
VFGGLLLAAVAPGKHHLTDTLAPWLVVARTITFHGESAGRWAAASERSRLVPTREAPLVHCSSAHGGYDFFSAMSSLHARLCSCFACPLHSFTGFRVTARTQGTRDGSPRPWSSRS